jgi:hypothetical protein
MPLAYEIVDWQRYEVADSRKCKVMQWVAVPINQDGLGYIELVTRPDGVRTIGGWLLILQLAARCPKRGLLVSDGGRILGGREIALKTRANEEDIKACLDTLCEVGWIRQVESSGHHPDAIRTPSGLQDRTGQDRTGQDKRQEPNGSDADSVGPLFMTRDGAWRVSVGFRQSLAELYPTAPLDVELAKAAAWTEGAAKKKTARGMHAFLLNWLSKDYTRPPTPPAERPSDDAMAELAAETARLRAAGQIK